MRVLLVDDNLLSRTRLTSALGGSGHEVEAATTAEEATAAARLPLDILIVNLTSAAYDASALIHTLRQDPTLRALPIWGFCGHRDVARRRAAIAAGCDRVVPNSRAMTDLPALLGEWAAEFDSLPSNHKTRQP